MAPQSNKNQNEDQVEEKTRSTNQGQSNTSKRGFASMDREKQHEIASKGGEAVSRNRAHMAQIGRKGGEAVSQNRGHMAEIGSKGGQSRNKDKNKGQQQE